ncbi:MAG: hypothetical protein WB565_07235 [Acidimicrobiales bacterium]
MTTGRASLAKAFENGFTPAAGSSAGPSSLESLRRYRERERDRARLAKALEEPLTPAEAEQRAHERGVRKAGRRLAKGDRRDAAFASAYRTYVKHGGRLSLAGWVKKCAR